MAPVRVAAAEVGPRVRSEARMLMVMRMTPTNVRRLRVKRYRQN